MTLADQREPVPRRGAARRFRPPAQPSSFELPRPEDAGPRRLGDEGVSVPAAGAASPPAAQRRPLGQPPQMPPPRGAQYVEQLEAQLRTLSQTVQSLEQQLAGYARRNQELEAGHMQLASYRAESERGVAERAAETIRDAEARAAALTAAAESNAARLEADAHSRSMELIETVRAEIDALEKDAQLLREEKGDDADDATTDAADAAAGKPTLALAGTPEAAAAEDAEARAAADEAALKRVRGEIGDLLKLREAILVSIRGAVEGFEHQLDELERPPLAVAGAGESDDPASLDEDAVASGADGAPVSADGPLVEVQAAPVAGVLEASRIEQELAATGADVHLRSVEGSSAKLHVRGMTPEQLTPALSSRFPGSKAEWDGDGVVRLALAPTEDAGEPEKKSS